MVRKNINQDEFRLLPEHKEHPKGPSMTVPDETLSIKEIVAKHIRGQAIADQLMREPMYDSGIVGDDRDSDFDSEDLMKVRDMDLAEQDEIKLSHREKIEEFKEKHKVFSKNKKEEEKQRQGKARSTTEEADEPKPPKKKATKEPPTDKGDGEEDVSAKFAP